MQNNNGSTTKYISRDQMQNILDNRPKGVDGKALIDRFIQDGYQVEGIGSSTPAKADEKSLGERLKDRVSQIGEGVKDYVEAGKDLKQQITGEKPVELDPQKSTKDVKGGSKILSGVFGSIGDVASWGLDKLGVTKAIEEGIKALPQPVQVTLGTALQQAGEAYDKVAPEGSTQDEFLRAIGNVMQVVPLGKTVKATEGAVTKVVPELAEKSLNTFKGVIPYVTRNGINPEFAANVVKSTVEKTSGVNRATQNTILKYAREGKFDTKFSDEILKNPGDVEEQVITGLRNELQDILDQKGKISSRYEPVLAEAKPFKFSRQTLIKDVTNATGLKYTPKTGFQKTIDTVDLTDSDIKKLNSIVDSYLGVDKMDGKQFKLLRDTVKGLAYDNGLHSDSGERIAKKLYESINKNYRANVKGLEGLDNELAPLYKDIEELKEYFQKDPRTGKLIVSDSARTKLSNLLGKNKNEKLERIKQFIPDIEDKLEYANALRNLDVAAGNMVGRYGSAGSQVISGVGGATVAGIPGLVVGLLANAYLQDPAFIAKTIGKVGKFTKKAEQVGDAVKDAVGTAKVGAKTVDIEPSVVQVVDKATGKDYFMVIPKGQLKDFHNLIDDTKNGIAGKEIDGKVYHLTAKTPQQMEASGFENMGTAKLINIPRIVKPPKKGK